MSELRPALVGGKGQRRPVLALEQLLTPWRTGGGRSPSIRLVNGKILGRLAFAGPGRLPQHGGPTGECVSTPTVTALTVLGRFENSHFWGT